MMYHVLVICVVISFIPGITSEDYTNLWAVQVEGGKDVAEELAKKHGFTLLEEIMPGFYHFRHNHVSKRSTSHSHHYQTTLSEEPQVQWLQQQVAKKRVKRDLYFTDPKWPRMWYLNRATGGNMNVERAWVKGFSGKGVVISILDDGIEANHPDLARNYDPLASYDVNNHDSDPTPRYDPSNENRHGTRCAGEVAAVADNNICSLGVAFNANIGGVRMLDGDVTDSVEAASLSLNRNHIDIYSASWGPDDDGRTVDGPSYMAKKAFFDGVTKGRNGLGSIFVWASGNGGREGDNCNCDGYTNSIYTLSISSATENGNIPWYSEACSSTLASTYSSGSGTEKQVVTTDLRKGCTETHTGTSASAPLAAGICALALQANPRLTWRDMQHIVVRTASPHNLHAYDWITNGVGRRVSHSFGYGIMDAAAMVDLALNWTTVPEQHICEVFAPLLQHNRQVPVGGSIRVKLATDGCRGLSNQVSYLEHVIVKLSLQASRRGEVQIFLVSPMGTRSTLLAKRSNDMSRDGFSNWSLMSTHSWGELSNGTWVLEVENGDNSCELKKWSLILHGTRDDPLGGRFQPKVSAARDVNCAHTALTGACLACNVGWHQLNSSCLSQCPASHRAVLMYKRIYDNYPPIPASQCRPAPGPAHHILGYVSMACAGLAILMIIVIIVLTRKSCDVCNRRDTCHVCTRTEYTHTNPDDDEFDSDDETIKLLNVQDNGDIALTSQINDVTS